mgnify:FL=1
MKKVLMMIIDTCPHCIRAFRMMEELKAEHPEYEAVEVQIVDENQHMEFAKTLNYWYVPCFFVDGEKILEGVPRKEVIQRVYEAALKG